MSGLLTNLPEMPRQGGTVAVLAVSSWDEDHARLRDILRYPNWKIHSARAWGEAVQLLRRRRTGVVICERDFPDGAWQDLLERLGTLPHPPPMIVTSRYADETLWAEVLNLGGYDVLAKPFDVPEVIRIVSLARLRWKESLRPVRSAAAVARA